VSQRTLTESGQGIEVRQSIDVKMKGFAEPVPVFEIAAVGEPFNLALPKRDLQLQSLSSPIEVSYSALDGKHVADEVQKGLLVSLSARGAVLEVPDGMDLLTNLWLRVDEGSSTLGGPHDLYAKVVEEQSENRRYVLRFTGIPIELARGLSSIDGAA
jgi:hypothetical protein